MNLQVATSVHETPVFFDSSTGDTLFGIWTEPTHPERLGTAVIMLSSARYPSTHRNQLSVRICRRLAAHGYHALRIDYHGAGESTGTLEVFRLDRPFVEDVDAAIRWIRTQGIDRFFLVGTCFGARTALAAAADNPAVRGLLLVSPPLGDYELGEWGTVQTAHEWTIKDYLRRLAQPRVFLGLFDRRRRHLYLRYARAKWRQLSATDGGEMLHTIKPVSPSVLEALSASLNRRIPVLFAYGDGDDYYDQFRDARSVQSIIERSNGLMQVAVIPGRVHAFVTLEAQNAVVDLVAEWLSEPGLEAMIDKAGSQRWT